jgi:hypothetical protein
MLQFNSSETFGDGHQQQRLLSVVPLVTDVVVMQFANKLRLRRHYRLQLWQSEPDYESAK